MDAAATAFAAWAASHAVRLGRGEDRAAPDAPADDGDLAPFAAMVGPTRLVAIGESFHHTHELLALRERLVRFLVERLGFRTILLEVLRPGPNPVDEAVTNGGDAEAALVEAGARMWRNRETARIVRWVQAFNRTAAVPVRIEGIDILAPGAAMRAVLSALRITGEDRLRTISTQFDFDGRADQMAYNALPDADRRLLHAGFRDALEELTIASSLHRDRLGDEGYDALVTQTAVVLQALRTLKAGAGGWNASIALRDAAMAENVTRFARRDPQRRAIILSHNTHVHAAGPTPAMGIALRARFGAAYLAIGTTFGRARFDPPIYGVAAAPGEDHDSIDQLIGGDRPVLLDLRADPRPAYLEQPARMQATGSGDAAHLRYDAIAEAFDIIAHVPALTNAVQLVDTDLALDVAAIDSTRRLSSASAGGPT